MCCCDMKRSTVKKNCESIKNRVQTKICFNVLQYSLIVQYSFSYSMFIYFFKQVCFVVLLLNLSKLYITIYNSPAVPVCYIVKTNIN